MRRFLSFLLALVMVLSMVPVSMLTALEVSAEPTSILDSSPSDHNHDHPASDGWIAWDGTTINTMQDGAKYYLTKDAVTGTNYVQNATVTVCLNGHSLTAADGQRIFRGDGNTSNLTICDCQAKFDSDGNLISENNLTPSNQYAGVVVCRAATGSLTMENVVIDGMKDDGSDYVANGNGGLAIGTWNANTTIKLEDCVIKNCHTTTHGGAIYLSSGVKLLETNRVLFENNYSGGSNGGGAICAPGSITKIKLADSTFKGNRAAACGGAIAHYSGTLEMTGCEFVQNSTTNDTGYGGALKLYNVTTMKDCSFTQNESVNGSAIYIGKSNTSPAAFTMDGCTVQGNTAGNTAAVYVNLGNLTVKGNTKITGNTKGDLYLAANQKLALGAMGAQAQVNVATAADTTDANTFMAWASDVTPADTKNTKVLYTNTDPAQNVGYKADGGFYLHVIPESILETSPSEHTHDSTWTEWDGTGTLESGKKYYLKNDVTRSLSLSNVTLTVCLNGKSFTANVNEGNKRAFDLDGTCNLTICDCKAEFDPDGNLVSENKIVPANERGSIVTLRKDNSQLTMENVVVDGAGITHNTGAVAILNWRATNTITLENCVFKNCDTTCAVSNGRAGGAIFLESGGTLKTNRVVFSDNSALHFGGAICAYNNSILELKNTRFENNASGEGGGAIEIEGANSRMYAEKVTFKSNTTQAPAYGGGAILSRANGPVVELKECVFQQNISACQGGAVQISSCTTTTLTDCEFNGNQSTKEGGAFIISSGSATLTDCTFTGNSTGTGRDGSAIWANKPLTLNSCQITGNTAGGNCAVSTSNTLTVTGNTKIAENTATNAKFANLYLSSTNKLTIGELGAEAQINVATATVKTEADDFMAWASGVTPVVTEDLKVLYTSVDPAKKVGYNATDLFYLEGSLVPPDPHDANHTGWTAWDGSTINGMVDGGKYYLTADAVTGTNMITDATVTVCLNGHSLTAATGQRIFRAGGANAKLTICDCKAKIDSDGNLVSENNLTPSDQFGSIFICNSTTKGELFMEDVIIDGMKDDGSGYVANSNGGVALATWNSPLTYTLKNCVIRNCHSTYAGTDDTKLGGAISLRYGGKLVTDNVVFQNNSSANYGGVIYACHNSNILELNDTTFEGNESAQGGGAIVLYTNAIQLKAENVTFKNNKVTGNTAYGGGAILARGGTPAIELTDCTFDKNESTCEGGAILTNRLVSASLKNCTFTDNKSVKEGGAVRFLQGTASMEDCTFTGNQTTADGRNGSAIWVNVPATLKNVKVTGNTAGGNSAVYSSADVTVSGNTQITDNNGGDLYLDGSAKLVLGALDSTAKINVATVTAATDPDSFMKWESSTTPVVTEDVKTVYTNTYPERVIGYNATDLFYFGAPTVATDHNHHACSCAIGMSGCDHGTNAPVAWYPWNSTDSLPTAAGNYYLTADVDLTKAAGSGKSYDVATGVNVRLCMNGKNIKCDQNNKLTHAYMVNGGSLTIMNCQAKLDANKQLDKEHTVGGKLTGASGTRSGVLRTYGNATLNLIGIELSDNEAYPVYPNHGGALLIEGGTANVKYCRFADNYSDMLGGAIALNAWYVDAPVLNAENTVFENNESRVDGGAIGTYAGSNATAVTINVKNCIFEGNKSEQGGAINLNRTSETGANAVFSMRIDGCTFTGNEATSDGGAVASYGLPGINNTVTVKNSKFIGNTVNKSYGGALAVQDTDLTVSGSTLQGNSAGNGGGAIHAHDANVVVEDSVLTENKSVKAGGGAIYMNITPELLGQKRSSLKVTGSTLSKNYVEQEAGDGGAIRAFRGIDVVLENNKITGNKAGYGSAISLQNKSTLLLKSGEISGNEAGKDGAIYVVGVTMTMTGGEIKNNTATRFSGGIAIVNGGQVIFSGNPVVYNNEAAAGDNICLREKTDKLTIGQLGDKAKIGVTTNSTWGKEITDPDEFLKVQEGVKLKDAAFIGILCDTYLPAKQVGYSNDKNVQFYFTDVKVGEHTDHGACACVLTDATCSHDAVKWEPWPYTDRLPVLDGNYYLTADVDLSREKGAGKNYDVKGEVKLCMNGYNIVCDKNNALEYAYFAYNGKLTVMNCRAELDANGMLDTATSIGGKISGATGTRNSVLRAHGDKAELTLIGVILEDNHVPAKDGQFSNKGGALLVEGGTVKVLYSRFANNTTYRMGGAIMLDTYVSHPAELIVENTSFEGNEAPVRGGAIGIYVGKKTGDSFELKLKNCVFKGNTSKEGGAIGIQSDGDTPENVVATYTIEGCTFIENSVTENGGAIFVMGREHFKSVVNMKDTTFTKQTTGQGGALHVVHTEVNGDGVIMEKGEAPRGGGAFYAQQSVVTFKNSQFNENKEGKSGGAAIYMNNTCKLQLDNCKFSKNIGHDQGDGAAIRLWRSTDAVVNNCVFEGNEAAYGGAVSVLRTSTLELNGCTFKNNKASRMGGALMANRLTSDSEPIDTRPVVKINDSTFTGNYARYNGGAIRVTESELIMNSGKVSGNEAKEAGGGIAVESSKNSELRAIFKFNGGSVTNNESRNGGGLFLGVEADMYQYGGYVGYNHVTAGGGGIYINADGRGYFYGGTYQGNSCDDSGAGIHTSGGKIYMYGATVKENKSRYWGGGIRVWTDGYMLMEGGIVENNEAGWCGGGLFLNGDTDIKGGKIINNRITPNPEYIDNNFRGGGICLYDAKGSVYGQRFVDLNISGGEISGNYSPQYGGGIYMNGRHKVTITGGAIKDNTAGEQGGGIMVDNTKHFRASKSILRLIDGEISGNSAVDGGGIYSHLAAYLDIQGGTIKGNTASATGGGMYLGRGTQAQLRNAVLTENTAKKAAALYFMDDTIMENLRVTGNESGDGYAVYLEKGDYDGESYVMGTIKMSGDMIVSDNKGSKADMFIGKGSQIVVDNAGMGKDTLMNIDLEEGVLTSTVLGAYNYEGGNLHYTLTYGDRSVTDVEVYEPPVDETQPEETTEPTADADKNKGSFGIGGIVAISVVLIVAVIGVLAGLSVRKKKKAEEAATESVQE